MGHSREKQAWVQGRKRVHPERAEARKHLNVKGVQPPMMDGTRDMGEEGPRQGVCKAHFFAMLSFSRLLDSKGSSRLSLQAQKHCFCGFAWLLAFKPHFLYLGSARGLFSLMNPARTLYLYLLFTFIDSQIAINSYQPQMYE